MRKLIFPWWKKEKNQMQISEQCLHFNKCRLRGATMSSQQLYQKEQSKGVWAEKAGLAWGNVHIWTPSPAAPIKHLGQTAEGLSHNPFKWSHCVHPCAYTACVQAVFLWWERWRAHVNMTASVHMRFPSVRVFPCIVCRIFRLISLHVLTVGLPPGWWRGRKKDKSALNRSKDTQTGRRKNGRE